MSNAHIKKVFSQLHLGRKKVIFEVAPHGHTIALKNINNLLMYSLLCKLKKKLC